MTSEKKTVHMSQCSIITFICSENFWKIYSAIKITVMALSSPFELDSEWLLVVRIEKSKLTLSDIPLKFLDLC